MQLLFYTLILPLLLAGYVFAVRKNFPPLRRAVVDTVVIAATCVLMFLQLLPPEQKIKLGRDLRGGVSLIYSVNTPAGANKQEVLSQTIKVLKNRVNPQGVLDLSMAPQGEDRIEIVMPLPGQEVRAQQKAYREALDALLRHAHLTPRELDQALAQGEAAALAGDDAARSSGVKQWTGAGAVAATRLRATLGVAGDDAQAIADVLRLHPAFVPGYVAVAFDLLGPDRLRIRLDDCEALREADPYHWYALLDADPHPALEAMAQAVNPKARCRAVTPPAGARQAWEIVIDPAAAAPAERPEVAIVAAANTARFVFRPGTAVA